MAAILFEKERQLVLRIIEAIDAAHIRLLDSGIGVGPVAIVANQAHGLGCKGGSKLDIAGSTLAILDGHTALAGATSIEMTAHRCYGAKYRETIVDGGQQHGVCTTARTTIGAYTGSIDVTACQGIVEQTLSTKCLIGVGQRTLMCILAHLKFRLTPSESVVADADGPHAGQRRKTHLQVLVVTTVCPMSVGTDDDGIAAVACSNSLLGNLIVG